MTKKQQSVPRKVAVCADSRADQTVLKAYVKARGWTPSGHVYRLDDWQALVADATDRKFTTVCAIYGGLRWLMQVAPETDFPRAQPKLTTRTSQSRRTATVDEHQAAIVTRARALTVEKPQTAETIAESLIGDGVLRGPVVGAARRVCRALLRSGAFAASEPKDGGAMAWRPWQPTRRSVEQADGHRIIYTEMLSTTGVSVQIAIPVKSPKDIAEMLLREVMATSRLARQETRMKEND